MTYIRDTITGVLVLVALVFGLVLWWDHKTTAQLRSDLTSVQSALATEKQLRSADVKSLSTRLEATRKAQEAKEKRDVQTAKALAESPQWSSERVPDAIVDSLGM